MKAWKSLVLQCKVNSGVRGTVMKKTKQQIVLFFYFIGLVALSRLIPHPPNFTPVIAMAVFMPYLTRNLYPAMVVPLSAMFVSDLYIGFHSSMFWVYGSILIATTLSHYTMSMKKIYWHLGSNALLSSTLFFVITNFAVWISGSMYPLTLDGLLQCYTMAIPFFGNTITSTIFYVSLLGLVSYSATNISRRYTDDEENITSSLNIIAFPHRTTSRSF
tara:strand:+ start:36 stop:686 length:651 start_codon:yes stop_codon:yes gene_type:complete